MKNNSNVKVSKNGDFILVQLVGKITEISVQEASGKLLQIDNYEPGTPEIWEITEADLSDVDSTKIEAASKFVAEMWEGMPTAPIAVVSENPINLGHANLFREYYQREVIEVFTSLKEAENWVSKGILGKTG